MSPSQHGFQLENRQLRQASCSAKGTVALDWISLKKLVWLDYWENKKFLQQSLILKLIKVPPVRRSPTRTSQDGSTVKEPLRHASRTVKEPKRKVLLYDNHGRRNFDAVAGN
jgi:hypothetical protein